MNLSFDFRPDPVRARMLNARMCSELANSVEHLDEACAGRVAYDQAAIKSLARELRSDAYISPSVFASYYDLVERIESDRLPDIEEGFRNLLAIAPLVSDLEVVGLNQEDLGNDQERYRQLMNEDASVEIGFLPATPLQVRAFESRLMTGLALLDRSLPGLSQEIRAIIRRIVIVGSDTTKKLQFDGGSHYKLWGALFLNCEYHTDALAIVEVLAHECAHCLLFGFCIDEALVENDDDELFASPLRIDLRPMDGIYHATFVSARMYWAMSNLAVDARVPAKDRDRARDACESNRRNFLAGYGVVEEFGRLTDLGQKLMASAKAYMDSAA